MAAFSKYPGATRAVAVVSLYWLLVLLFSLAPLETPLGDAFLPLVLLTGLPVIFVAGTWFYTETNAGARELAMHDDLTGLHNRRAFTARFKELLRSAHPGSVSLVLLDVDGLKLVNDTCGHQAGDELLIAVARHLEDASGSVYRLGGDEFAILLNRRRGDSMTSLLDLFQPMRHLFQTCGHRHPIGMSYGMASNRADESPETLFSRADAQLREFKQRLYESGRLPDRRSGEAPAQIEEEAPAETKPSPISFLAKLAQRRGESLPPGDHKRSL